MALTAGLILGRAQTALQDQAGTRWPLTELLGYLNSGIQEIALQKPTSFSKTVLIPLAAGTYQVVPTGYSAVIRGIRNITSGVGVTPRIAGRAIQPARRADLDAQFLDWHDVGEVPMAKSVMHIIADEADPLVFYTFPPNDGTGLIEAVAAEIPAAIPVPASPTVLASYTAVLPLSDIYEGPLADYVMFRALSKETTLAGAGQKAQAHYQLFASALGLKQQIEAQANVNATKRSGG
jgi:hypothetical protein